jgi:hypothetical protein
MPRSLHGQTADRSCPRQDLGKIQEQTRSQRAPHRRYERRGSQGFRRSFVRARRCAPQGRAVLGRPSLGSHEVAKPHGLESRPYGSPSIARDRAAGSRSCAAGGADLAEGRHRTKGCLALLVGGCRLATQSGSSRCGIGRQEADAWHRLHAADRGLSKEARWTASEFRMCLHESPRCRSHRRTRPAGCSAVACEGTRSARAQSPSGAGWRLGRARRRGSRR